MKYHLTAYHYGDIIAEKSTDDYASAKRFYKRFGGNVRVTVFGEALRYPESDRLFQMKEVFRLAKAIGYQDFVNYKIERARQMYG